jgi:RHS repeat-associated protein
MDAGGADRQAAAPEREADSARQRRDLDSVYAYDPYGNVASFSGSKLANPFQFAGQYTDPESGLQYLRARYYDPATAQFISKDPLTSLLGQPYAYAADNPTTLTDPSGLYVYDYRWGLGNWGSGADVRAMQIIQAHPNLVFPFYVQQISPRLAGRADTSIQLKARYKLHQAYGPLDGEVRVTALSPTSFTFTALYWWNPEGEGSTITFTTSLDSSGNLILHQHAQGPDFDLGPIPLSNSVKKFLRNPLSQGMWGKQAINLLQQLQLTYQPMQLAC